PWSEAQPSDPAPRAGARDRCDSEGARAGEDWGAPGARRSRATRRPEPARAIGATVRKLSTSAADAGAGLARWLAARLGVAPAAAAALCAGGSVSVDGRRVRDPSLRLTAGRKIVIHDEASAPPPTFRTVYADANLVVVDKPAGVAVMATRDAAGALDEAVAA